MIRRRLSVPVAVAARRADAVRLLEPDCDLILCDDGLQHYALARDLEVVVVDGMRGFGNGRRLPAGPLREPVARLEEADAVVVNGAGLSNGPARSACSSNPSRWCHCATARAGRCPTTRAAKSLPRPRSATRTGISRCCVRTGSGSRRGRFRTMRASRPPLAGAGQGKPVLLTEKDAVKCGGVGWARRGLRRGVARRR